jgi:hypothetical protein
MPALAQRRTRTRAFWFWSASWNSDSPVINYEAHPSQPRTFAIDFRLFALGYNSLAAPVTLAPRYSTLITLLPRLPSTSLPHPTPDPFLSHDLPCPPTSPSIPFAVFVFVLTRSRPFPHHTRKTAMSLRRSATNLTSFMSPLPRMAVGPGNVSSASQRTEKTLSERLRRSHRVHT